MCCVIARWFALQARHSATACYVKSWWRDGAMCDATVKQYNVLQCPYPDTVFIFGNINTSSTHLFVFQWFAINLVLDWNIFHIGWNCQTVIINGCRFRLTIKVMLSQCWNAFHATWHDNYEIPPAVTCTCIQSWYCCHVSLFAFIVNVSSLVIFRGFVNKD